MPSQPERSPSSQSSSRKCGSPHSPPVGRQSAYCTTRSLRTRAWEPRRPAAFERIRLPDDVVPAHADRHVADAADDARIRVRLAFADADAQPRLALVRRNVLERKVDVPALEPRAPIEVNAAPLVA